MANADAAFGFRPINRDGSPYSGGTIRGVIASGDGTATFIGDPVKIAGSSVDGAPSVIQAAAGDPVFAVVVGFEADPDNLKAQYRLANTQRFCKLAMVDSTYFEVQSDDDSGTLDADSIGLNANFIVGSGDTTYGISGVEINSDGADTTNSLDLQLIGFPNRADNEIGSVNQTVIVKFNDPQTKPVRTGV